MCALPPSRAGSFSEDVYSAAEKRARDSSLAAVDPWLRGSDDVVTLSFFSLLLLLCRCVAVAARVDHAGMLPNHRVCGLSQQLTHVTVTLA